MQKAGNATDKHTARATIRNGNNRESEREMRQDPEESWELYNALADGPHESEDE